MRGVVHAADASVSLKTVLAELGAKWSCNTKAAWWQGKKEAIKAFAVQCVQEQAAQGGCSLCAGVNLGWSMGVSIVANTAPSRC